MMTRSLGKSLISPRLYPVLPFAYATVAALFLIARYQGRLADSDSSAFALWTNMISASGSMFSGSDYYTQGVGFQLVSTFIVDVSGLSIQSFQLTVYPLVAPAIAVMAFIMFRMFTGSARIASIASFFLFLQPEYLFILLRGNHEKVTFILVLLAIFLLVKGPTMANKLTEYAKLMGLFYLFSFALVTVNVGFASSWVFAVGTSCALGYFVSLGLAESETGLKMKRLFYISTSSFIFIFIFAVYLYTPAFHFFRAMSDVMERASMLLLGAEITSAPYDYVDLTWRSPIRYLVLTAFNWIVLLSSFVMWLYLGYSQVIRRAGNWTYPLFTLWLFYAAFGFQIAMAVMTDQVGGFSGNFQIRIFPFFMLFAIPLAAMVVDRLFLWSNISVPRRSFLTLIALMSLLWFSLGGLMKATNDPYFSNKWVFYAPQEKEGIKWAGLHIAYAKMWVDFDERLKLTGGEEARRFEAINEYDSGQKKRGTKYAMISEVVTERSKRLGAPLPNVAEENKVYDNGLTFIYHFRPRSVYQD